MDEAQAGLDRVDAEAGERWVAAMRRGDFAAAWRESDAIRGRGAPDAHRFWEGEAIAGRRVMLRSLHGLGDAVQMLRWVPRLASEVDWLFVEVPPRFAELARCLRGMDAANVEVRTWEDEQPVYDVHMEVMELPYLFRVEGAELPGAACYLGVPEDVERRVGERMGDWERPRVGVAWSAGEWNESRSVPVEAMDAVLGGCGVEVWSLQGERANGEAAACFAAGTMRDGAALGEGLLTLAATVANLDAVVTVDTLLVHVAGAMGVPALLLLQEEADWRWMEEREDTPWYPSVRLLRRRAGEGWAAMMERVPGALADVLAKGTTCNEREVG